MQSLSPWALMFIASSTVASFAQVLLKKGAAKHYTPKIREYLNIYVISGYGLMFVGMFLANFGYRFVEYKVGSVMESWGFFMVMVLSRIFFGEKITKKKLLGNVMILAGILIFNL